MSEPAQTPDLDNPPAPVPSSAEDRKAATALAALDSTSLQDQAPSSSTASANLDAAAVQEAMARLEGKKTAASATVAAAAAAAAARTVPVVVKSVKVDQGDVALLVDQLEVTKPKATELLRAHGGDAIAALRAYVTTPW